MKLYNLDHSPYATRVRMQIFKKELPVAIEPPPAAARTAEFLARFPLGKIPVLELDDGSQLPDSWVIMEYLEDVMPAISLRPDFHQRSLQLGDIALAPHMDYVLLLAPMFGRDDPLVRFPLVAR